jgi:hypothetical protein
VPDSNAFEPVLTLPKFKAVGLVMEEEPEKPKQRGIEPRA